MSRLQNLFDLKTAGTSQRLKLTLNVETEEYMAGPASGSGAFVSKSNKKIWKLEGQWNMWVYSRVGGSCSRVERASYQNEILHSLIF